MPETTQFSGMENEAGSDGSLKPNHVIASRYKIISVIGGGGMGTVYQGRDLNFTDVKRMVAIKEMQSNVTDAAMRSNMIKTFRREANLLAQLNHPAIPRIFDIFEINDRAYLVMEYINGSDLELLMTKVKEFPMEKLLEWAVDLADVLHYLHSLTPDPIIFRDMKPSNIMVDNFGKVRLIDFGIARTFVSGQKITMIGTEGYSAPEQYKGDANPRSDIYALGATFHHLLTRKDPRTETPFTFHERPIPNYNDKVPADFTRIIEKALSFKESERYQTCLELKQELERARMRLAGIAIGVSSASAAPGVSASLGESTPVSPTGTGFLEEGAGSIQAKWVFKTEDEIRVGPSASKDLAYVGSYDSNVWAVKLDTGELAWKHATHGGIASAPVYDEASRLLLFGSEDMSFYAVDYRTGRISWSFQAKGRFRSTSRVAHNVAFAGNDDGKVYALALSNGRQMWAYDMGSPVRTRPFVTNELVIAGCEGGELVGITLSGARKWSYRTRKGISAAPVVDDEGTCFVGAGDGFLYALDSANGYNAWRFRTNGPIFSSPVEHRGYVYFGSADGVCYCVNAQSSRERWKFTAGKPFVGGPVVFRGMVYIGNTDGYLYCLDAETGKERWKFKTGASITSNPFVAGETLLVGSMDNKLYGLPVIS
jgi:outer membrane protein assembly factor BamB/tRNA A-37 threonylcarbamoyl transferase component Bud32